MKTHVDDPKRHSTSLKTGQRRASPGNSLIQIPRQDVVVRFEDDMEAERASWIRLPESLERQMLADVDVPGIHPENRTVTNVLDHLLAEYRRTHKGIRTGMRTDDL